MSATDKLAEKIRKLEVILKAHGCTFVMDGGPDDNTFRVRWDGRKFKYRELSGAFPEFDMTDGVRGGWVIVDVPKVTAVLTNLVTFCIEAQRKHEAASAVGVADIDAYLSDAPWFREEIIDPVEGVYPKENE